MSKLKRRFLNPNQLGLDFITVGLALFLVLFFFKDYEKIDITFLPIASGFIIICLNALAKFIAKHTSLEWTTQD